MKVEATDNQERNAGVYLNGLLLVADGVEGTDANTQMGFAPCVDAEMQIRICGKF